MAISDQRGITIIEAMIVLVVIGLVFVIGFWSFSKYFAREAHFQSVQLLVSSINDSLNDVRIGSWETADFSKISCGADNNNPPQIKLEAVSNNSGGIGLSDDCLFVGKSIHLGVVDGSEDKTFADGLSSFAIHSLIALSTESNSIEAREDVSIDEVEVLDLAGFPAVVTERVASGSIIGEVFYEKEDNMGVVEKYFLDGLAVVLSEYGSTREDSIDRRIIGSSRKIAIFGIVADKDKYKDKSRDRLNQPDFIKLSNDKSNNRVTSDHYVVDIEFPIYVCVLGGQGYAMIEVGQFDGSLSAVANLNDKVAEEKCAP